MPNPKREHKGFSIPRPEAPSKKMGSLFSESAQKTLNRYAEENVIFSWQFFDREHKYFNCGNADQGWLLNCLETMKKVSGMKVVEFKVHRHKPLRVHPHNWDHVSAKFPLNDELFKQIENDAYQFALSTARGRVHGFLIDNVFYIVWLDPDHNLYPSKKHGGIVKCDPPDDCYDCYSAELLALEEEKNEIYSEIDRHALEMELKTNKNDFY
ncbi:hypothetical protein [Cohnella algarum]|uniref:hypothetical protein n=1 Tax=Cohnella algarum TaxID=2044859 RepID=UPI00196810A1|nr:hypothetical protein [Cohnella algarum]MBN2980096.1 hypothetical protein [Cohnella algarum]